MENLAKTLSLGYNQTWFSLRSKLMQTIRNEAIINPSVLLWARESAGFRIEEAAKKAQLKSDKLIACEQGQQRLTISQLRKLSNAYKRPLAFFYLPKPPEPEIDSSIQDFRRFNSVEEKQFSPELRIEIRKAKYRREVAIEMFKELEIEIPKFNFKTSLDSSVIDTGLYIREFLKITKSRQEEFKNDYEALNYWREAIEATGVLVFQATLNIDEMRGLSIAEFPLPIILVNQERVVKARIFTMLHELTHIMLRSVGVCDLETQSKIEVFCNAVAGEVLVPTEWLSKTEIYNQNKREEDWNKEAIWKLADYFSVSREVILRRLLTNQKISNSFYQKNRFQWLKDYEKSQESVKDKKSSGFAPPHTDAISKVGKNFTRLVVNSYYQNKIGLSEVSDYLGVKAKHLPKIEQSVFSSIKSRI
jgi:Zn-dependent peptidase ImmA (M78 family)